VQLDAWNWEDALVREDGIHLNWPAQRRQEGWGSQESKANEGYEKEVMALYQFFDEARAYIAKAAPVVRNQKFEALRPLFAGSMALYLHVGGARLIQEAVLFAERYGVKPVLSASPDAWKQAAFLKEHGVPVILSETQRLPATEDEAIDQPERGAVVLHAAGVPFAFSGTGFWRQRNLPFHAGQSVGVGLPYEAAIRALTLDAAKILGVGDRLGSLEVGKEATLFISSGDALDMRSCLVSDIFIAGRAVSTDNRHKRLARKYSKGS
jgi:imidazolonepropionase-like amidohydrolase